MNEIRDEILKELHSLLRISRIDLLSARDRAEVLANCARAYEAIDRVRERRARFKAGVPLRSGEAR